MQSHDAAERNEKSMAVTEAQDGASSIQEPEELPFNAPLSHELFLSPSLLNSSGEFDASAFLLTRKHVSLDDLRSELRTYLQTLRNQLISIINNDYEDFINLGGSHLLGSEDQMSLRMRKPLEGISREIRDCRSSLEEIRDELTRKLKRRELVRKRKLVCRKLLGVNEQVNKVEEMLFISSHPASNGTPHHAIADAPQESSNNVLIPGNALVARNNARRVSPAVVKKVDRSMGSDTKRLERIAQEYNQLLYLVRKSEGLKFVESLQSRIDRISSTLQQDLSSLLSSTLTSLHNHSSSSASSTNKIALLNDHKSKLEALAELFRTYASINKCREAEEVVRKVLVIDFMSRTIHREALLGPQSPLMPITPFSGTASGSTPSAGGMFGSFGQAFSQASPSLASPVSSFPFPPAQNNASISDSSKTISSTTLTHEERSLIPPFYVVEPVTPPPVATESDTYISDALVELYNKILVFISKELGYILEITERRPIQGRMHTPANNNDGNGNNMTSSGIIDRDTGEKTVPSSPSTRERILYPAQVSNKAGYEVLSNVIWSEIAKRLMNECGHLIFAAGRPDSFHRNYLITLSFIERLESLCPNVRYLQILRSNPEYSTFVKRWQLPVYFQLRFREIIGHLEGSLAAHTIAPAPSAVQSTSLTMAATEQIYKAMSRCWSDDVYLSDLSPRFWRLTLQILSRYKTWLDAHLPDYVVKDAAASVVASSTNAASAAPSAGLNLQRLLPSNPLSNTSTSSRPSTPQPQSVSDDSSDDGTLRQLSIVISDITKLESMALHLYERTISPKLPKVASSTVLAIGEGEDTPEMALSITLESLTSTIPSLLSQVATILSKRCAEPLRLVRSGASQVRANASKNSTGSAPEPSYFVPNILRPAKVFLEGHGKVLHEDMKRKVMQTLFEDLANRYEAALSKMKKDGDALRRLKKGRQGFQLFGRNTAASASNDAAASAEDEKVRMQMDADIKAFARDAMSLGVALEKSEALEALRAVVRDWNK